MHNKTRRKIPDARRIQCLAALLLTSSVTLRTGVASAGDDMRSRIAEIRKKLEAERQLPEDQRWQKEEDHVRALEERAEDGELQASQFLELARLRLAKLRRERLIQRWGRALNDPDVAEELRVHARRTAHLKRIRLQARARSFPELAQRADELLAAEKARHEGRLLALVSELRGGASTGNVAATAGVAQ